MIKFFRKIRLNLLTEGKTAKYFKNALGEINQATRRYRPNVDLLLSLREDPFLDNDNKWIVNRIPEGILQEPKFIWLLEDINWRISTSTEAIEDFLARIDMLIQDINNEIDSN